VGRRLNGRWTTPAGSAESLGRLSAFSVRWLDEVLLRPGSDLGARLEVLTSAVAPEPAAPRK